MLQIITEPSVNHKSQRLGLAQTLTMALPTTTTPAILALAPEPTETGHPQPNWRLATLTLPSALGEDDVLVELVATGIWYET